MAIGPAAPYILSPAGHQQLLPPPNPRTTDRLTARLDDGEGGLVIRSGENTRLATLGFMDEHHDVLALWEVVTQPDPSLKQASVVMIVFAPILSV